MKKVGNIMEQIVKSQRLNILKKQSKEAKSKSYCFFVINGGHSERVTVIEKSKQRASKSLRKKYPGYTLIYDKNKF